MPEPIKAAAPAPLVPSEDGHSATPVAPAATPTLSVVMATPPLSDLALECISKVDAVLIPIGSASASPLVAVLAGFKAGYELAECFDDVRVEVQQSLAVQECLDVGGTPIGVVGNVVNCQVVKP